MGSGAFTHHGLDEAKLVTAANGVLMAPIGHEPAPNRLRGERRRPALMLTRQAGA